MRLRQALTLVLLVSVSVLGGILYKVRKLPTAPDLPSHNFVAVTVECNLYDSLERPILLTYRDNAFFVNLRERADNLDYHLHQIYDTRAEKVLLFDPGDNADIDEVRRKVAIFQHSIPSLSVLLVTDTTRHDCEELIKQKSWIYDPVPKHDPGR